MTNQASTPEDEMSDLLEANFSFCTCGQPGTAAKFIVGSLEVIEQYSTLRPYEAWRSLEEQQFGQNGANYFFYYWATKEDLLAHGGSVPGWLTDKGKFVLSELRRLLEEDKTR